MRKKIIHISVAAVVAVVVIMLTIWLAFYHYRLTDAYQLEVAMNAAEENSREMQKALNHFSANSMQHDAMEYLIRNMPDHYACEPAGKCVQSLQEDIKSLSASYLIQNVEEAFSTWQNSPWRDEVDFMRFCQYILPYKIDQEPVVEWRCTLKDKYAHLVADVTNQREAFTIVFNYLKEHFKVQDNKRSYEADILTLDSLQGGDCRERAIHMVYVMRALGIAAALDYTPFWANQGTNAHYWVSMISRDNTVYTIGKDSLNNIDGTYEPIKYHIDYQSYPYSVDSLKRIAKVYRVTYDKVRSLAAPSSQDIPLCLRSVHAKDVTTEYHHLTRGNMLPVAAPRGTPLYVCTFQQRNGWIPIGEARRVDRDHVDIGPLIHDNVVVVASYEDGTTIPLSNPFLISHDGQPKELSPDVHSLRRVKLLRKYYVNSRWPNRWGDMIGAVLEASNDADFRIGKRQAHKVTRMPVEKYTAKLDGAVTERYIRFLPADGKYPVPAEIDLIDHDGQIIPKDDYRIYAVGDGLTGDPIPIKWLRDNDPSTTFYKQFPYWIGIELVECRNKVSAVQFLLWNDMNRITLGHDYELFYFDREWRSLGQKRASADYLEYDRVPSNALLLLRDYTKGKEERIFVYENAKQVWW